MRGGGWRNDGGDGDCNGGPHARGGGGPCDASAGSNRSWPGMTEGRGRFSSGQWARERVIRGIFRKVPPSFPSFRGSKEGSIGSLAPEGPNEISVRQFEEDSWQKNASSLLYTLLSNSRYGFRFPLGEERKKEWGWRRKPGYLGSFRLLNAQNNGAASGKARRF